MKEELILIKNECRNIYRQAFQDDLEFEELLFSECFEYCRFIKVDEKVVSILFALPCKLIKDGKTLKAIYIFAAATLDEYKNKGYMTNLIEKVKVQETDFIFLRPANDTLIKFYSRFGFLKSNATNLVSDNDYVIPIDKFESLTKKLEIESDNEEFNIMYFSKKEIEIKKLNFLYSME